MTVPTTARILWQPDLTTGVRASGPDAEWRHVQARPDVVADDGVATPIDGGLQLDSRGHHPETGEPAYTQTVGGDRGDPDAVPGFADHAKWIAYAARTSSAGYQGFDAVPGEILSVSAHLSGRTFGTAGHPFGDAVAEPDADPRLAGAMLNTIDPETSVAFDFVLTNKTVFAFYGRTNFSRRSLGSYGSFAATVPLAARTPEDWHDVTIAYDRAAGTVRWLLDGDEAFRVDRIGMPPERSLLTLDEGGECTVVEPRQLSIGMGMLSLLDGSWPTGRGLVRLSTRTTYYRPETGPPTEQGFVDDESRAASRLFGQGARLRIRGLTASSAPA